MIEIAQLILIGIIVGSIIGLGAMGLTLVYGVFKFANFAHADLMTLGMYLAFFVYVDLGLSVGHIGPFSFGWGMIAAVLFAWAGVAAVSVGADRFVFRRLRARQTGLLNLEIAALGIAIALQAVVQMIWGSAPLRYHNEIHEAWTFAGGLKLKADQLLFIILMPVLAVALYLLLHRTRLGTAMRAPADNAPLAEASGIDTERVRLATWVIAAALTAVAGVMFALQSQLRFDAGVRVPAAADVRGGHPRRHREPLGRARRRADRRHLAGALDGVDQHRLQAGGALRAADRDADRASARALRYVDRGGRLMLPLESLAPFAGELPLLVTFSGGLNWTVGFLTTAAIFAIVALALNVQWGYTGTINFGVVGFFGIGAYVSALLTLDPPGQFENYVGGLELPVPVGWIGGALAGGVLALLVGLPTLRLRDDFLAIATIGIATILRSIANTQEGLVNRARGLNGIPAPSRACREISASTTTGCCS